MEDVGDPCGSAGGISRKGRAVGRGKVSAERGNDAIVDATFSDPAQGEDDLGAFWVFGGNKAWGNVAEDDFGFAATDAAAGPGGQVPASHGNLVAEAKYIGRVGTGGEYVAARLALDEILHGIVAGTQRAERGMIPGQVVKTAPSTADGAGFAVAGKRLVHRRAGSQIEEILRCPDVILRPRANPVEDGGVDGIGVFVHGVRFRQKHCMIFGLNQDY